jgi:phosphoglycerate kinase
MEKLGLEDLPDALLESARVLVRVDYNVPLEDGRVGDDTRIRATLPTLGYLLERRARIILTSHLGRPGGRRNAKYSLQPVATRLSELLERDVGFVDDTAGDDAAAAVAALEPGSVLLLQNARFLPGEEANDVELSERLGSFADIYINDAFGTAHRAHATTAGVAEVVRRNGGRAAAGFLMQRELRFLGGALSDPDRPFMAVLGGAKISGKIDVIEALLPRVDRLVIGGAMANNFFRAMGLETGASLVEEERVDMARDLMARAGDRLLLPVDCVIAAAPTAGSPAKVVDRDAVPHDQRILDIGPRSVGIFATELNRARTILWNGPMGLFEVADFADGTIGVALAVAEATQRGAVTIAGGGDTAAALEVAGLTNRLTHVSTGGGASLELLEGRELPGVTALEDREVSR